MIYFLIVRETSVSIVDYRAWISSILFSVDDYIERDSLLNKHVPSSLLSCDG